MSELHHFMLTYTGFGQATGRSHVVTARSASGRPLAVVGQLEDNPGTSITNAIERVAEGIGGTILDSSDFELIEYHPLSIPDLEPALDLVQFHNPPYRMPVWHRLDVQNSHDQVIRDIFTLLTSLPDYAIATVEATFSPVHRASSWL